ncbi:MAG: NlpC/P60 family protein [Betaproteobacteria bacterium]|nr:NlpC/P60 family protein [Betaproteobacteria bacterium]
MAHWSDKYVGRPYIEGEQDCAVLAEDVQREEFGRQISLPTERAAGLRGLSRQIESLKLDYAVPTDTPAEGDGVLMIGRGNLDHIGIYCVIGGTAYVLHAASNARQVVRHRLRDLPGQGLPVEGFYKWI